MSSSSETESSTKQDVQFQKIELKKGDKIADQSGKEYKITRKKGHGGYGEVFSCKAGSEKFVVKTMSLKKGKGAYEAAELDEDSKAELGIIEDLGLLVGQVTRINGQEMPGGNFAFIMPDKGENFKLHFKKSENQTLIHQLTLALKAARQLKQLHLGKSSKSGIRYLQCDVKGKNIVVDAKGNVTIVDYGQAREARVNHPNGQVIGYRAGTENYRAPEANVSSKNSQPQSCFTYQSDIYSLGKTFWYDFGVSNDDNDHPLIKMGAVMRQKKPENRPSLAWVEAALAVQKAEAETKQEPEKRYQEIKKEMGEIDFSFEEAKAISGLFMMSTVQGDTTHCYLNAATRCLVYDLDIRKILAGYEEYSESSKALIKTVLDYLLECEDFCRKDKEGNEAKGEKFRQNWFYEAVLKKCVQENNFEVLQNLQTPAVILIKKLSEQEARFDSGFEKDFLLTRVLEHLNGGGKGQWSNHTIKLVTALLDGTSEYYQESKSKWWKGDGRDDTLSLIRNILRLKEIKEIHNAIDSYVAGVGVYKSTSNTYDTSRISYLYNCGIFDLNGNHLITNNSDIDAKPSTEKFSALTTEQRKQLVGNIVKRVSPPTAENRWFFSLFSSSARQQPKVITPSPSTSSSFGT